MYGWIVKGPRLWAVDENVREVRGSTGMIPAGTSEEEGITGPVPAPEEIPFRRENEFSWVNEAPVAATGAANTARASRAEITSAEYIDVVFISVPRLYLPYFGCGCLKSCRP